MRRILRTARISFYANFSNVSETYRCGQHRGSCRWHARELSLKTTSVSLYARFTFSIRPYTPILFCLYAMSLAIRCNFADANVIHTIELSMHNVFRWDFSRSSWTSKRYNVKHRSQTVWNLKLVPLSQLQLRSVHQRSGIANQVFANPIKILSFRIENSHIVMDYIAVEMFTLPSYRKKSILDCK